jgi:hypothetical protein
MMFLCWPPFFFFPLVSVVVYVSLLLVIIKA